MMKNKKTMLQKKIFMPVFLLMGILTFSGIRAQSEKEWSGEWRGTSQCQVKNSPCNDEVVVYRIVATKEPNSYKIDANKVVKGKEEFMGTLTGTYDPKEKKLICIYNKTSTWTFQLKGTIMDGTLLVNDALYRIIHLRKEN